MVNTANAEGRVYRAEKSRKEESQEIFQYHGDGIRGDRYNRDHDHGCDGFETGFSFCRQDCPGTWLYGIIFRCSHSIGR